MNTAQEPIKKAEIDVEEEVASLVPTKKAYLLGFVALILSGISGGLIGYASSKIFVHNPTTLVKIIFALTGCIGICWSMSVVVTIGLKASVEYKSRKKLFPSSKRPSKIIRKENELDI